MIILNENQWVENVLETKHVGDNPYQTYVSIARYYFGMGLNKAQVKQKLCEFIRSVFPKESLVLKTDYVDRIIKKAKKANPVNVEYIPVTKAEMETIDSIEGVRAKRMAFTLLCLAKYWKLVNPNNDGWVNNRRCEISKLACCQGSRAQTLKLLKKLVDAGLIQTSDIPDNTNIKVLYLKENSEEVLRIYNFMELGYQYEMFKGSPQYFICEQCGHISRKNPGYRTAKKPQKYCKSCAEERNARSKCDHAIRVYHEKKSSESDSGF